MVTRQATRTEQPPGEGAHEKPVDELAHLEKAAADLVGEPAPGEPAQQPPQDDQALADDVYQMLVMVRAAAGGTFKWWPSYREVWSDATLRQVATAGAQVMLRHGWTVAEVLGKYGPYIALAGVLAPPVMITADAIAERKQLLERQSSRVMPPPTQQAVDVRAEPTPA